MAGRLVFRKALFFCLLALTGAFILSLMLSSADISTRDLFLSFSGQGDPAILRIIQHVRLPRTIAAVLAGSALAGSGLIIQSVLGNPLAGPNIIGVNAGAGMFVVLCAAFLPAGIWLLPTAAFLGALIAMLLVYAIARLTGASRITLVLAGIAVSSILSACIDAIVTLLPDTLNNVNAFRIGSIAGTTLNKLYIPGAYILFCILLIFFLGHELEVLALGDETAVSLGLNIKKYRFLFLLGAAILSGAAVSFCGLLGFVGLIVPHASRFLVGNEVRRLFPISILLGGTFVTLCDVLARVLFAPFEIPVGIVMSFIGGPFFLWLLIHRKGGRTNNA